MNIVPICDTCGENVDMNKDLFGEWYCTHCHNLEVEKDMELEKKYEDENH